MKYCGVYKTSTLKRGRVATTAERIVFRPVQGRGGAAMYELTVPIAFDRLFARVIPALGQFRVASPTVPSWNQIRSWLTTLAELRRSLGTVT